MESLLSPPRPAGLLQLPRGLAASSAWGLGLMGRRCRGETAPGMPQSSRGVPASWSRVPLWVSLPPEGWPQRDSSRGPGRLSRHVKGSGGVQSQPPHLCLCAFMGQGVAERVDAATGETVASWAPGCPHHVKAAEEGAPDGPGTPFWVLARPLSGHSPPQPLGPRLWP